MFDLVFVCLTLILELLIFRVSVTVRQRRREVAVCRLTSPVASCRQLLLHGRVSGGAVGGGVARLPTELPRCAGRVTETVIVVDTCLDHCLGAKLVRRPRFHSRLVEMSGF